ncbi:hypothetical protein Mpsy_0843 [Methanolobus psychrophilus R15]|nr:hypothetical protein Mpsy_0843 [Methanolobus psychrophilus R15]
MNSFTFLSFFSSMILPVDIIVFIAWFAESDRELLWISFYIYTTLF